MDLIQKKRACIMHWRYKLKKKKKKSERVQIYF